MSARFQTNTLPTAESTPPFPPSRVPRYRFGDTLERQEGELAANSTLARMIRSRKELAADPHRPLYHFVSPESTLNDPNGLCYWQGNWHLFYQANPPHNERVHWGHAVSSDPDPLGATCPTPSIRVPRCTASPAPRWSRRSA